MISPKQPFNIGNVYSFGKIVKIKNKIKILKEINMNNIFYYICK
jgi:hypothetical protein